MKIKFKTRTISTITPVAYPIISWVILEIDPLMKVVFEKRAMLIRTPTSSIKAMILKYFSL